MEGSRTYIAIDLKSYYASVECVQRGLNPLTTHLVVADATRTDKTICLAVTPALKAYGVGGRPRLFEVEQKVKQINLARARQAPNGKFLCASYDDREVRGNRIVELSYIVAPPQMALYMSISAKIFEIYSRYVMPEDIHPYSIDEVFIDATHYLELYHSSPRELAMRMIRDVLDETGITATAGIGTNLYLCKVAMDIVAKHMDADEDGVRIAELDEQSYRSLLWSHRPLTDFWRVGPAYQKKLEMAGLYTMGDIARCSLGGPHDHYNPALLYQMFGANAELLMDHAWGYEPCTMADIKAYRPETNSLGCGQVLSAPYTWEKGRIIVREMAEGLAFDLIEKGLVTDQIVLHIGFDRESLVRPDIRARYQGAVASDHYGRAVPKPVRGTANLGGYQAPLRVLVERTLELYDRIVPSYLLIRRVNVTAAHVVPETSEAAQPPAEQLCFFTDPAEEEKRRQKEARERRLEKAMLSVRHRYGKNALLRGTNLQEGATARERNQQIGGHRA